LVRVAAPAQPEGRPLLQDCVISSLVKLSINANPQARMDEEPENSIGLSSTSAETASNIWRKNRDIGLLV
jgi:hypothetical protein